jgi:hypothetical protein
MGTFLYLWLLKTVREMGRLQTRVPVSAKIALASAGAAWRR